MKLPIINKPEYTVYVEMVANGCIFVHCDVYKWNKTVLKALSSDWEQLVSLHNRPIYAYHYVGDTKHEKFLKLMGFKHLQDCIGNDLRQMQLYIKGGS